MPVERCLVCGETAVTEHVVPMLVEHGAKSLTVPDRRMVCAACGNASYHGAQISEHERAKADAIREMEGLLSAADLGQIRAKYAFRQADMEQMLATGPKTWTRWERGKVPQSKAADKLIRLIAEDPCIARKLMEQAGVVNAEATETFDRIERDAKAFARILLRAELGERPSPDLERFADRVADRTFETMAEVRHRMAMGAQAA